MEQRKVYKRNSQYIVRYIDKKAHILNPLEGKLFILNETATFIWRLLWKSRSIEEVTDKMLESFDTNAKQVERDIRLFLNFAHKVKLFK